MTGVLVMLGVLALVACAMLLSYHGILQLAVQGGVAESYAHAYPVLFTVLVLLSFGASYVLREASLGKRTLIDLTVLLLLATGAAASAVHTLDYPIDDQTITLVVAAVPWVAAGIGFYLAMAVGRQLRAVRQTASAESALNTAQPTRTEGDTSPLDTFFTSPATADGDEAPQEGPPEEPPVEQPEETQEQRLEELPQEPEDLEESEQQEQEPDPEEPPEEKPDTDQVTKPELAPEPEPEQPTLAAPEVLPRRTPGQSNFPKPTQPSTEPLRPASGGAAADASPAQDEGFVPDEQADDPAGDEGLAQPEAGSPAPTPSTRATAADIPRRAVIHRPGDRHRPDPDPAPAPTTDPPSGQVRSAPVPPAED